MKNNIMRHFLPGLILLLMAIPLSSCDNIAECISGIRPELEDKSFPDGSRFANYNQTLDFEITNGLTSEYYITDVDIDGFLPPNITHTIQDHNTIRFAGLPDTAGTYDFKVTITVDKFSSDDGTDGLCSNQSSKSFSIKILQ